MDLTNITWSKSTYSLYIDYLFSIKDIKYRDFSLKLGINNVIGIRVLLLRRIASSIYKGNYIEYLNISKFNYYEEKIIYAFLISKIKDIDKSIHYLNIYKNHISSWAETDLFISSYKIVKDNKDRYYSFIKSNITSSNPWIVRLCFVMLLYYYIDKEYLSVIFDMTNKYNTSDYYVNMAVAWLIAEVFINYKEDTIIYLKNNSLDRFTHNKIISKINDSNRVGKEDKMLVSKLKK